MKNSPIGVFDSGMGGISVLRQLQKRMPRERFLYYGDCAHAPYGTKTRQEVQALTCMAADALFAEGVKALVVACNTATGAAIDYIRGTYPDRIIVGIEPAILLAEHEFPEGRLAVMATPLTLQQEKYQNLLHQVHSKVISIPIRGLVELVEAGKADSPETAALLAEILGPYRGKLDALVLGCTHYPFAARAIEKVLGPETRLLDGGEGTARETCRRLAEAGLLRETGEGEISFLFSGRVDRMDIAENLLKADIPEHL